jgi:alanine-alpha-ketoisovalerate/valine-pyruvate aminotransferase
LAQHQCDLCRKLRQPNSNVVDLETVAQIAHAHGIPLIVDNTFATPYLLAAIEYEGGHRGPFGHQVNRRTWHIDRRP